MLVYGVLLLLVIYMGFILDRTSKKNKKQKNILFFIIFFFLFIVSAIRYNVGRDYMDTYVFTYNLVKSNALNIRIDIGFFLLNKIIIIFNGSYQWVFVVTSFIINFFVCKVIVKESDNKMLSLFIYICGTFYFFSMNGIRQSISIALFYYSLYLIEKRKMFKYMFINLIGASFHASALLFLPLYFILDKDLKKKYRIIFLIILIMLVPTITQVMSNFLLKTKYYIYINNGAYNPLSTLNLSSILNIILFFTYEFFIPKKDKKDIIYSNVHFIGIIISLFLTQIPLMLRIFVSFRYIEFLSVPNLINKLVINNFYKKVIKVLIIIFYFIYFIYGVYIMNGNTVLPYKTIFLK